MNEATGQGEALVIGVVSDTHGNLPSLRAAVAQAPEASLWIHCGDGCRDVELERLGVEVHALAVSGNCDSPDWAPRLRVIDQIGWRLLVVHGDRFHLHAGQKGLVDEALRRDAHIICYGHTHHARHDRDERVHLVNPGALARGERRPSFARITLCADRDPLIEIVEVVAPALGL